MNDLANKKFSARLGLQPKSLTLILESFLFLLVASAGARCQVYLPRLAAAFPPSPQNPQPHAVPSESQWAPLLFTKTHSSLHCRLPPAPHPTSAFLLSSSKGRCQLFFSCTCCGLFPPKFSLSCLSYFFHFSFVYHTCLGGGFEELS